MLVLDSLGRKKDHGPSRVFKDYFDTKILKEKVLGSQGLSNKVVFGVSIYPLAPNLPIWGEAKRIGLSLKQILMAGGSSARVVLPQRESQALPSVAVTNEHLLEKGAEIDFLVSFERIYLAKTLTVQDFEDYGRRDYQRPIRDSKIGMLPPKVAQIMINLAQVGENYTKSPNHAILDPFVGSGTIVQEAMIMGFRALGSDISEKAVENAEKNLSWIKNRYKLPPNKFEVFTSDVSDLKKNLPKVTCEAIVTEGTLGPTYAVAPDIKEIHKNFAGLVKIYTTAFKIFKTILGEGKRVVIAFPAYRTGNSYVTFPIVDKVLDLGYHILDPLPDILLEQFNFLKVTSRKSIVYDRKDQFVSREIFIFKS